MNYLDIIIIAFLSIGFILGYKDGLIRKIIGFIGLIAAVYLSIKFAQTAGYFLSSIFGFENYFAEISGGVLIFIGVTIASSIIKRVVHPHDRVGKFTNQLLGGVIGALQLMFFLSAAFLILNIFDAPGEEVKKKSAIYKPVTGIIPGIIDLILDDETLSRSAIKEFTSEGDSTKDNSSPHD